MGCLVIYNGTVRVASNECVSCVCAQNQKFHLRTISDFLASVHVSLTRLANLNAIVTPKMSNAI